MTTTQIPSEAEVLSYFDKLSNWGRWGVDDELGTPNLITPEKTKRAIASVQEGVSVSLSRDISWQSAVDVPSPPVHYMLESGEGWASGEKVSSRPNAAAIDYIGMVFHGVAVTHVDSLAHFFWQGKTYNGKPAHLVSTSLGATVCSVEAASKGFMSRGVLVDVPRIRGVDWVERGEGVMPEDILAAEERCGFQVDEGDILLIRTGQLRRRNVEGPVPAPAGSTACQAACLPLFHERGIAVMGSDTGNDVRPAQYEKVTQPIHQVGITAMGLWILDNANLEEVAEACAMRSRWDFLVSINPLRLQNTTGSPVNPIAVF
jgi:kynurenine formamidase